MHRGAQGRGIENFFDGTSSGNILKVVVAGINVELVELLRMLSVVAPCHGSPLPCGSVLDEEPRAHLGAREGNEVHGRSGRLKG